MENSHPTVTAKEVALKPATAAYQPLSLAQRRAFMQLSLEERHRLLSQQAEEMLVMSQHSLEWQELQTGDIVES